MLEVHGISNIWIPKMQYLSNNSIHVILLLNTSWNCQQVTVTVNTELPFKHHLMSEIVENYMIILYDQHNFIRMNTWLLDQLAGYQSSIGFWHSVLPKFLKKKLCAIFTYRPQIYTRALEDRNRTFFLELLVDHRGLSSKSDLACTIPRGKLFNLPEKNLDP